MVHYDERRACALVGYRPDRRYCRQPIGFRLADADRLVTRRRARGASAGARDSDGWPTDEGDTPRARPTDRRDVMTNYLLFWGNAQPQAPHGFK